MDATPTLTAQRELELKLFVPTASIERLWSHPLVVAQAIEPLRVARLVNRYFDTPQRELAARGMALRLRRSGRQWVQTLKTRGERDGPISVRGEWETPVAGPSLELGKLVATPLVAIATPRTLAKRLVAIFSTDFRRESRMLRLADGSTVEFAFDRGTIATGRGRGRRTAAICEVEIELKSIGGKDAERQLLRFAAELAAEVALIPLAASKAARGYRLADAIAFAVAKVALPDATPTDRARPHLARVLAACNDALLADVHGLFEQDAASSASLESSVNAVECVHQARVAIRRMRSALHTFRPVAKGGRFESLDEALRTIGHTFGDVRDRDVLASSTMKRLEEIVGRDVDCAAALATLGASLAQQRDAGHRTLTIALETGAFGATTLAVQRLVGRLTDDDEPGPALGDCVPRWLTKQFDRVVDRARRIAVLDLEARHVLRIEVKRLRYALDLFEALFDVAAVATFRDALADLQARLGKLNDEAIAEQLLRSLPPSPERDLVLARYAAWFERHLVKQLPKVGAQSVALELTPRPWLTARIP